MPQADHADLLVGFGGSDDAGVYRIDADKALVLTADFITPPVDDARVYGEIAAANALSDVYAMGGRPLACLHLACFPTGKLDQQIRVDILAGSMSKVTEAGAVVAGGHTVQDDEPKFGLSVTGVVHPERIWTNRGAEPGDKLILTKPLGSGVLFNANLKGLVSETALSACIDQLTRLNDVSAETFASYAIHAATDISGFGLAGHAYEVAKGSNVTLHIDGN
ncbi:MAG: selenide, water dikinase SelD, partial [Pseudomonadales bacterium]|nr:selenide, water dikinase SelD [Pseudomonadales bacterium]